MIPNDPYHPLFSLLWFALSRMMGFCIDDRSVLEDALVQYMQNTKSARLELPMSFVAKWKKNIADP